MRGIERTVLDLVAELVAELRGPSGRRSVALGASLDRDLGLGSLERVELVLRLERALGVVLPEAAMAEADTVGDVVAAVCAAGPAAAPVAAVEPSLPPAPGTPAPPSVRTLPEALAWHAEVDPARVHIVLYEDDDREQPITYGTLQDRPAAVAAGLEARGLRRGDAVALMLRTEADFFPAFFGILLAGAVPVPIYPPFRLDRLEEYAERQIAILRNAGARLLVTFPEAQRIGSLLRARVPTLEGVTAVAGLAEPGAPPPGIHLRHDDPALIQYTSGSTGDPKGVLLTHANLLANIEGIRRAIAVRPDDVGVSWLPLYHDMGLIGSWLAALCFGIPIVILSPLAFLARPARWLWAVHHHRATLSAAPNFAFELCVRRIRDEEIRGLDLGSWRAVFNGAEPVSPETLERFRRRFAPYGLRAEAVCPVYGLAESAAALTVPPLERGPWVDHVAREPFERSRHARPAAPGEPNPLRFVSGGRPIPDHEVRVVDAEGRPLPERVEGRIEFRGPSITGGYVRNPAATRAVLRDGWMDSGDLGYLADGELFITGRRKDVLIKGGRNLHPQEVEAVVGDVPGVRQGCVAAFGVVAPELGTERLVVVAESRQRDPQARARLEAAIVERVVARLGVPPDTVVIAPPGAVLKTSSGKVRRSATREAWLHGRLAARPSVIGQWVRLLGAHLGSWARRLGSDALALGYTAYAGILLGVTLPPLWGLALLLPPGGGVHRLVRGWCRLVLALGGCPLEIHGLEHLQRLGPAVLAANHASYLDAVVLAAALPVDFRFIAKRELTATPLVRTIIRKVGHLTVERADLSRSLADAERAVGALRSGTPLLFFPEGTFERPAALLPFKLGAFKAAVEAGCPVVPVALCGTREILPAYRRVLRPRRIVVTVGSPLHPEGESWREMVRLRDAVRAAIAERSGEAALG